MSPECTTRILVSVTYAKARRDFDADSAGLLSEAHNQQASMLSSGRYRVCQIPLSCAVLEVTSSSHAFPASAGIFEFPRGAQILNFRFASCVLRRKATPAAHTRQWAQFGASPVRMQAVCLQGDTFLWVLCRNCVQ